MCIYRVYICAHTPLRFEHTGLTNYYIYIYHHYERDEKGEHSEASGINELLKLAWLFKKVVSELERIALYIFSLSAVRLPSLQWTYFTLLQCIK